VPKIAYIERRFGADAMLAIQRANEIAATYAQQGFDLTLRQLYYQFVSRGWLANKDTEYKRLGSIINDARLAGRMDWNHITDRTRNLRGVTHWNSPADIIRGAMYSYHTDKWADQPRRVEVWIEKDALVGVLEVACRPEDVDYFSCRGYTSQSEVWGAAQRLLRYRDAGQEPVIIHLGDHDPSGIDMTRDITDRLDLFCGRPVEVHRIALNYDQVQAYNPPPNPAKLTDSRAEGYIRRFGDESWELDALEPNVLVTLIRETVASYRDEGKWAASSANEAKERKILETTVDRWLDVVSYLEGGSADGELVRLRQLREDVDRFAGTDLAKLTPNQIGYWLQDQVTASYPGNEDMRDEEEGEDDE
jgi:hypothetical protein